MDIDIDVRGDFEPLKIFPDAVKASRVLDGKLLAHPCGVYFQDVPVDPITKLAAPPYDVAEALGCFKIDFLHLSVYDYFSSKAEILALINEEPDWNLLQIPSVVQQLFQLSKHHDVLQKIRPRSVLQLADCLALIRPGKLHLMEEYQSNPGYVRHELYRKEEGAYGFKKAHAVAYALAIVLQLHLIKAGVKLK